MDLVNFKLLIVLFLIRVIINRFSSTRVFKRYQASYPPVEKTARSFLQEVVVSYNGGTRWIYCIAEGAYLLDPYSYYREISSSQRHRNLCCDIVR